MTVGQQQIQKTKTASTSSSARRESQRDTDQRSPSGKTVHKN